YGRDRSYLRPALPIDESPNLAIRDGQWKLLTNDDGSRLELYQIGPRGEIDEFSNVAGAHPDIAHRLSEPLLAWRKDLPSLQTPAATPDHANFTTHRYSAGDSAPSGESPQIASRAFRITARVDAAKAGDGVIVS